jgi:hypothetical protein
MFEFIFPTLFSVHAIHGKKKNKNYISTQLTLGVIHFEPFKFILIVHVHSSYI